LQPFLIRCLAAQMPLLTEFIYSLKPEEMTDIRRSGLQKTRTGMFGAFVGALQCLSTAQLRDSYRLNLLESLAETASVFAPLLHLTERKQILNLAEAVRPTLPSNLHVYLAKITQAMSDLRCQGLCSF
ncbi:MAG TPA: hypothetical protein VGL11_22060, partial [Candidatus Binatia bacterium]